MAGSLDDHRTVVLGAQDYDYVIVSKSVAEIWVSPRSTMTRTEIAEELRRVATFVEGCQ